MALAWYGYELIRGALEPTAGSVLFSLFAQDAFGKLRAKVAYHREWLQLNTRAKDERALFVPASEAVVERYDDICVICHDNFEVDGARRLTRTTPIKLPRGAQLRRQRARLLGSARNAQAARAHTCTCRL